MWTPHITIPEVKVTINIYIFYYILYILDFSRQIEGSKEFI